MRKVIFILASLVGVVGSIQGAPKPCADTCPPSPCKPCVPCVADPVMLGCTDYVMESWFTGMALQPYANNVDYASEALPFNYGDSQAAISPSWVIPTVATRYHFAFDVGVKGNFRNEHTYLALSWERFHSSNDTDTTTVSSANNMVGTFFEIGPDASTYKRGKGSIHFHFDEVNVDYGTMVDFGKSLRMNLFAGVGFARLKQHWLTTLSDLSGTVIRTVSIPKQFLGAGPQLGLNFDYRIVKGFRFVGDGRGTLFVGTLKNSTTFTTQSNVLALLGDQNPNVQTTSVDNKGGIVPGLEGRLGLAYETDFCKNYLFKIEAGYQAQLYINALRSVDLQSEVNLGSSGAIGSATTGVYARTFSRTVSDFALAGPYATIQFGF